MCGEVSRFSPPVAELPGEDWTSLHQPWVGMGSLRIWGLPARAGVPQDQAMTQGTQRYMVGPTARAETPRTVKACWCPCHQRGDRFQPLCHLNTFEVLEPGPCGRDIFWLEEQLQASCCVAHQVWRGLALARFCTLPELSWCAKPPCLGGVFTLLMPVGLNQERRPS